LLFCAASGLPLCAASGLLLCAVSGLLLCAALLFFACENPESGAETAQPAGNENGNGNGNGDGNGPGQNPGNSVPIKRLTVSPRNAEVIRGGSLQFTALAEGAGEEKPDQSVVWSVIGEHDTATAIDNAGLFTAAAGEAALTLTIRAAAKADAGKYGSATVSLIDAPSVAQVTVMPQTATAGADFPCQFTALVEVTGNAAKTVVWSLQGNQAAGTAISADGLLTVDKTEPVGAALTVTATSTVDAAKSGSALVTIAARNIPLASLTGTKWVWDGSFGFRTLIFDTESHLFFDNYSNEPNGAVYDDYYTYDSDTGRGTITGGYPAGDFILMRDNQIMHFFNYKNYGHSAEFTRLPDGE
jgi:hypothetical protein